MAYFGKSVRMIYLEINKQETGSDPEEYRADVVIIEDSASEEQTDG